MSANLHTGGQAKINVHRVTNMVLHPIRTHPDGAKMRRLMIHTEDGEVEIDIYPAADGNTEIAELI